MVGQETIGERCNDKESVHRFYNYEFKATYDDQLIIQASKYFKTNQFNKHQYRSDEFCEKSLSLNRILIMCPE